jgi:hypothetical protein
MNWLLAILCWVLRIPQEAPWKHGAPAGKDLDRAAERRVRRAIERRLTGRSSQGTA